jgi:hypothetical protein
MTSTLAMKKLATNILLLAIILLGIGAKDPVAEALPVPYGEVVFVRAESMGKLNIVPAFITCDMWQRLVICGGQVASVYLPEGAYEFQALSCEPYDDSTDITACRSAALSLKVTKGKKAFVEIIPQPATEKLGFHWLLREKKG